MLDRIELSLFSNRVAAVCSEMGAVLRRAAFSPNIKDRLDFSCAVFDTAGRLTAQAAHIPVHLGSMGFALGQVIASQTWQPGDTVVLNDPYMGGTHLPDVTMISPVFVADECVAFVANRAHHADIGAASPGSMPLATRLDDEGQVIAPLKLVRQGQVDESLFSRILERCRNRKLARGDFSAQLSANQAGVARITTVVQSCGVAAYRSLNEALQQYGAALARQTLEKIPAGHYGFDDVLDGDGIVDEPVPIRVTVHIGDGVADVDFQGTAAQVAGNLNCPLPVTAAAVYYCFRCLMPDYTPSCAGVYSTIRLHVPPGSLLNARRPAAVAAGNVETSSRIVDVVFGALAQALPDQIPAASQGTMNNIALGGIADGVPWDYYETIAGGAGASARGGGADGVHSHMTNTLNTPIESVEMHYPLRITRYQIREGSGGVGRHCGGNGLLREYQFMQRTEVTLLCDRRWRPPWGLAGGAPGQVGENRLGDTRLPGKVSFCALPGSRLTIATPGGGGWGKAEQK